jgi:hypothetical protein
MPSDEWQIQNMQLRLEGAESRVRQILDATKDPKIASGVDHTYEDKYLLSEFLSNTAVASWLAVLGELGLGPEQLATLKGWSATRTVTLRFRAEETCSFARKETRKEEAGGQTVVESSLFGSVTSKVVHTITEWFWDFAAGWEVLAVRGAGEAPEDTLRLHGRKGALTLKTTVETPPRPALRAPAATFDLDLTWLLRTLGGDGGGGGGVAPSFAIDRAKAATPRRNRETEEALRFVGAAAGFAQAAGYYLGALFSLLQEHSPAAVSDITALRDVDAIFLPVLPFFDGAAAAAAAAPPAGADGAALAPAAPAARSPVLGSEDTAKLLAAQARGLAEKRAALAAAFPAAGVATGVEAALCAALAHGGKVCARWAESLDFVEGMLYAQLHAAVGHEVTAAEFGEYMAFHHRRLFAPAFRPLPFAHSVRRSPAHSPEGTLSIECGGGGGVPVATFAAARQVGASLGFALGAATRVELAGEVWLHAWLRHTFAGDGGGGGGFGGGAKLVARARQFSGFVVLVGRIADATTFDPQHAFIVQNKDEVTIPLELAALPTPKEFKDAIASLSPEQQRFARAVRAMQLNSTLFAVCVVQIKPQLEQLLRLAPDSLTKEIALTQDLMKLFIDLQVPADLVAFGGDDAADGAARLAAVKAHVEALQAVVKEAEDRELDRRAREEQHANPIGGGFRASYPVPAGIAVSASGTQSPRRPRRPVSTSGPRRPAALQAQHTTQQDHHTAQRAQHSALGRKWPQPRSRAR